MEEAGAARTTGGLWDSRREFSNARAARSGVSAGIWLKIHGAARGLHLPKRVEDPGNEEGREKRNLTESRRRRKMPSDTGHDQCSCSILVSYRIPVIKSCLAGM